MFQKIKKRALKAASSPKLQATAFALMTGSLSAFAQNTAGDYSAGTNALLTVSEEIAKYVPIAVKVCYAIAGVVAVVGAVSVYIAMNNEEQDVKKRIMTIVGACIFLVATVYAKMQNFVFQQIKHNAQSPICLSATKVQQ